MEAAFDDANPWNPSNPARHAYWGDGTADEVCIGIFDWLPADDVSTKMMGKKAASR
jgi:hypothetical protein